MFTKVNALKFDNIKEQILKNSIAGSDSIEKPYLNSLLGQHLASNLCKTLNKCDVLKNGEFDMDKILQVLYVVF